MSSEANQNVAAAIRAEMARKNVSNRALAAKVGRSQMWVSRRTTGTAAVSVNDAHEIADALGIDPALLLTPAAS